MARLILCILSAAAITHYPQSAFGQREWTHETAILTCMKIDPDERPPEFCLDDYIKANEPETWKRIDGNEFGLRRERKTLLDKIEGKAGEFKLEGEFVLHTQIGFGEYDFDEKAFPVDECRRNHDWKVAKDPAWEIISHPPRVRFSNAELLKWIKLDPDTAEKFLESRMDEKGRPNRRLKADLVFRPKQRANPWLNQTVKSELVAFKFYEDDERKKVIYEFPIDERPSKPAITAEDVLREVEGDSEPSFERQK